MKLAEQPSKGDQILKTVMLRSELAQLQSLLKNEGLSDSSSYFVKYKTWITGLSESGMTLKVSAEQLSTREDVNTQVRLVISALQSLLEQIRKVENSNSNGSASILSRYLTEDQKLMSRPSDEKIKDLLSFVLKYYKKEDILEGLSGFEEYMSNDDHEDLGRTKALSHTVALKPEAISVSSKTPFGDLYQLAGEADAEPLGYSRTDWSRPKQRRNVYEEIKNRWALLPEQNREILGKLIAVYEAWVAEQNDFTLSKQELEHRATMKKVPSLQELVLILITSELITDDMLKTYYGEKHLSAYRIVVSKSVVGDILSFIEEGGELTDENISRLIESRLSGHDLVKKNERNLRRWLSAELLRANVVSFWNAIKNVLMPAA